MRVWKRSKEGVYYAVPFHIDEAIKIYFENLKRTNFKRLEIKLEDISKILMETSPKSVKISGMGFDEESVNRFLESLDVNTDEHSDFLLIPFGLEMLDFSNFEEILKGYREGIVVFANPTSEKSLIWRYPPFRVIRPYRYLKTLFNSEGFEILDFEKLNDDFYVIHFSK